MLEIEDICKSYKLTKLSLFTIVARDPNDDEMIIIITNESGSLHPMCKAILKQEEQ